MKTEREKELEKYEKNTINLGKINPNKNFYIIHQTNSDSLKNIVKKGFNIYGGLNGTTLWTNKEDIEKKIKEIRNKLSHKGADSFIVFEFPKREFKTKKRPQLDDISDKLLFEENLQTIPNKYIFGTYSINYDKRDKINKKYREGIELFLHPVNFILFLLGILLILFNPKITGRVIGISQEIINKSFGIILILISLIFFIIKIKFKK